jgi:hypothetical protein
MEKMLHSLAAPFVVALSLTACGGGDTPSSLSADASMTVDAAGFSSFDAVALGAAQRALPIESISPAEQASLAFMREEEKLARDVYTELNTLYASNTNVFGNIALSEATHTEAVRQLLVRYNLPDPAATTAPGVFQNPILQNLYTQLLASGSVSFVEGLKVGIAIEELDILDIQAALLVVDNRDIVMVYNNLLKGSRNHLRAFEKVLLSQGVAYVPQYLSQSDYDGIVTKSIEF